jgi:hypothetical protein
MIELFVAAKVLFTTALLPALVLGVAWLIEKKK